MATCLGPEPGKSAVKGGSADTIPPLVIWNISKLFRHLLGVFWANNNIQHRNDQTLFFL